MQPKHLLAPAALFVAAVAAQGCSSKTTFPDRPAGIVIDVTDTTRPNSPTDRIPIDFTEAGATTFTIDLKVVDLNGAVRTSFTGHDAWLRLSTNTGSIASVEGPGGPGDGSVIGANVHLDQGVARGVKVRVTGAFGNTRIVAQDLGYVPKPGGGGACADGEDNDRNGLADFPIDPNCLLLDDDSETSPTNSYGTSAPIYFAFARINQVQGPGSSPFVGRGVELQGNDPIRIFVSHLTKDGMYMVDTESDLGDHKPAYNALFVYNFNPPPEVHICDRVTRINGNISIFGGAIQMGTAAWSIQPWLNPVASGPCPLPDFIEVTNATSNILGEMQPLAGRLITIADPTVGEKFGRATAPGGEPAVGASNCDLNGDGIAGCNPARPGFRTDEDQCCATCDADIECTEWNDFKELQHVKIFFGPPTAAKGTLFAKFSYVPGFDVLSQTGPSKLARIRGTMSTFVASQVGRQVGRPDFTIEPRCGDDVIYVGQNPDKIRDVTSACVCYRDAPDSECIYP
jgi:hypothetical protein